MRSPTPYPSTQEDPPPSGPASVERTVEAREAKGTRGASTTTGPPREPTTPTTGETDEVLLARFREGELAAFEVLVVRYERPLYNFLLRSVRDPHRAKDLLQEVFVRVIQRADKFRGTAKFSTWLYTIARNLCIDHNRRMAHRRHRSLDAPVDRGTDASARLERVASGTFDAERIVGAEELQRRIASAVEELPEEQREVFLMRQLRGLPFRDIADVVGVPVNTVKSRMRYALERLQAALADYEDHAREGGREP